MIFVITGETSSGKTTLAKLVEQKLKLKRIVNHTTRPPREGEIDGVDYHFTTNDKVHELDLICKNTFHTAHGDWTYGVNVSDIDKTEDYILVLEAAGVREIQERNDLEVQVIYVDAPLDLRRKRAYSRENKKYDKEIERRFKSDAEDFKGLAEQSDLIVLNVHRYSALKQIEKFISQQRWIMWCRL